MLDSIKKIHFIGIGGAGMSALAYVLIKRGYHVTGSDTKTGFMATKLAKEGAVVFIGHAACQIEGAEAVVVSTAIRKENPELVEAYKRKIPVIHRSDVLAYLINQHKGVAVAGAHGKTTTSSMLACICAEANMDPTVIIGGVVSSLGGNALNGHGDIVVAEADESDGSFLKLHPYLAVITNIENDHLDHYGSEEKIQEAFDEFVTNMQDGGKAILCYDNDKLRALGEKTIRNFISYAIDWAEAEYIGKNIMYNQDGTNFDVYYHGEKLASAHLMIPGKHNVLNALGAIAAAQELGVPLNSTLQTLKNFCGAQRRFETKGKIGGVWVVDDYAHHPTEIKATLKAAKQTKPKRLICVFQPHRYSRTQLLLEDFSTAFVDCDELILANIYSAGEDPIEGIDSKLLAKRVVDTTKKDVKCFEDFADIETYLKDRAHDGDLIMTVGAGDIYRIGEALVAELKRR